MTAIVLCSIHVLHSRREIRLYEVNRDLLSHAGATALFTNESYRFSQYREYIYIYME